MQDFGAFMDGDLSRGVSAGRVWQERDPGNPIARWVYGSGLARNRQFDEARTVFAELEARPDAGAFSRMAAMFLAERAIIDTIDHDDAAVLRQLRRILTVSRIQYEQPMLISALVSVALYDVVVTMLERLGPQLNWDDPTVLVQARALLKDCQALKANDLFHAYTRELVFSHYFIRQTAAPGNAWIARSTACCSSDWSKVASGWRVGSPGIEVWPDSSRSSTETSLRRLRRRLSLNTRLRVTVKR